MQRVVFVAVIRCEIGLSRTGQIKQNHPEPGSKHRRDKPPHVLVAAKTMSKDKSGGAFSEYLDVVALQSVHSNYLTDRPVL